MLRFVVLLLLLANGAYYAWAQGLLQPLGLAPAQQAEPERLARQIRPQALRVLPPEDARQLEPAAAAKPAECLQALVDDAAATPVRQALAAWPPGSWTLEPVAEPGRWIVYMGKYPNQDNVEKKKTQLRQIGVAFEPLSNPELEPGLSLGGFGNQADADRQLERLVERGVRTARVVQERAELRGHRLTLAAVDEGLHGRLDALRPALGGRSLQPCR